MSIVNTDQAERWNSGEDLAHWLDNQARYDRMNEPFTALILDAAAFRPGAQVLDVGCGCGGGSRRIVWYSRIVRTGSRTCRARSSIVSGSRVSSSAAMA